MPDNPISGRKKRTEKWGNGSGTDPRSGNFFGPAGDISNFSLILP
jgi:hypothetical protein